MVDRHIEPLLHELLESEPVVVLDGPRTAGKSFVARRVASGRPATFLDLDEPADLENLTADPTRTLSGPGLVVVDEFQRATREVLGTIKANLNRDGVTPGRYLLTGSTRADLLVDLSDYLTGRHHRRTLYPYSQAELDNKPPHLLKRLLDAPDTLGDLPATDEGIDHYLKRVVAGGFPLAVARTNQPARRRWFRDYLDGVTSRAADGARLRGDGSDSLSITMRGAASITGQLSNLTHIQRTCSVERGGNPPDLATVRSWVNRLEKVHLLYTLEPWGATLRSRVTKTPKIHVVDSGLAAHLLGVTDTNVHDRSKRTESGHLLETFVVMELVKQHALLANPPEIRHFRTSDGHEVDVIFEDDNGQVFGVEVKGGTRLTDQDLAGLELLARRLGNRFGGGLVLHSGKRVVSTSVPRVFAAPISSLWAG